MSFILDAQKLQTFECWYCKSSQTTKASPNKEVCDGIKIDGGSKCWNNPSISYNSSSVTLTDKITKESYTFYLSRTKYKTIDSLVVDILNCVCKASGRGQAVTSIDINQINDSTIIFITNISRDTVIIPNKSVWVSSDSVLMQGSDPVAMACNFVKKCETSTNITWNNLTNEYYYVNEKNEIDTIGYSIGLNAYNIYHINHSGDTINKISTCDLVCPNTVSSADDNFTTNNCNVPFCNSVVGNDQLCDPGLSSISVVGLPSNGIVNINDNGYFCFTFTACDPDATYGYSYQITCPDGTSTTSVVSIDLTSTCPLNAANEDFVLGYKNNGININAAINDLPCSNKVYSLQTQPTSGILFFNQNGTGIYNPNSGFTGSDSCIVLLKCDGQSCDTSWLKIFVLENSPADSTYYLFAGQTITGDGSANDVPCTPPSTTTYNWTNTLTPSYAGTLTGTPSAWTYVSSATYCGDSYREYEQICTPPGAPGSKAKEMFKSVCAVGVPDFVTILDDTTGTFNVSSNDLSCTNGAATTWHLFQAPTFSGTKTHGNANDTLWLYSCKGNCPVTAPSPSDKIGHIHSWDTLTGNMTYYIPSTYEGDLCFKYIMRCRLPNGTWKNDDTVCVTLTREITPAFALIQINTPDTLIPNLRTNITAYCGEAPTQTPLQNGDKIHVNILTDCGQTVDVDLIVGQNIKLAAGYTNDVGGKWASLVVPSITTATPTMTAGSLLSGTFQFDLRKDTLAKISNCWGDGTVNANRIGSEWRWSINADPVACSESPVSRDTIAKMYNVIYANLNTGSIPCGGGGNTMVHHSSIYGAHLTALTPLNLWEFTNINSTNSYWVAGGGSTQPCSTSLYLPNIGTLLDLPDCVSGAVSYGAYAPITSYVHNHSDITIKAIPFYAGNIQYPDHHLIGNTYHGADTRFTSGRVYWGKSNVPLASTTLTASIYNKKVAYAAYAFFISNSFPSGVPIDHKVWIGNNPLDISSSGVNRTNILTSTYGIGWWNQGGGSGAYNRTESIHELPIEGFYNYSNFISTTGRPEFLYGHGSINLFSY